ncbi:hypothetical protein COHA_007757 [Chlorella ohadii]|uniref:Uncharacterized protein n=1 Tax=Chlorella ohadii TaxID=2649997 RepID=A0AAD5DIA5_9CHLO|nr:hypothetical protein COHA_007757 [Chlorella ohadii]
MRAPGSHRPGCADLHCSGIAGTPCSIMQTEGMGSSPHWLSSATESSEVATPLLRQCARRRQHHTRQQRRSNCSRLEALLAVVQESLKAKGAEILSNGVTTRSMRRSAPAAQPAPGAAGTPGGGTPCGAEPAARAAAQYRQQVFETLLKGMPPRDAAALLQAKRFLASFGCPA